MESLLSYGNDNMFKFILNGAIIPIEGARPVAAIISYKKTFPKSRVA